MKKLLKWLLILVGLFLLNLSIVEYLLRVDSLFSKVAESSLSAELKDANIIYDFSPNMAVRLKALGLENKFELDSYKKEKRISYSSVREYNPYPPILHAFDSAYVIYNKNFKLRQITILTGECDATPSILVNKARGEETGFGDHFVTYIFYQNEMGGIGVDYDKIDWYSWRGGSYDGFEELWIFPLTLLEILALLTFSLLKKIKKIGDFKTAT